MYSYWPLPILGIQVFDRVDLFVPVCIEHSRFAVSMLVPVFPGSKTAVSSDCGPFLHGLWYHRFDGLRVAKFASPITISKSLAPLPLSSVVRFDIFWTSPSGFMSMSVSIGGLGWLRSNGTL